MVSTWLEADSLIPNLDCKDEVDQLLLFNIAQQRRSFLRSYTPKFALPGDDSNLTIDTSHANRASHRSFVYQNIVFDRLETNGCGLLDPV